MTTDNTQFLRDFIEKLRQLRNEGIATGLIKPSYEVTFGLVANAAEKRLKNIENLQAK
jgi:hypothetical protein